VLLQKDNAHPHTAKKTLQKIERTGRYWTATASCF
jgi:hypothetical protein